MATGLFYSVLVLKSGRLEGIKVKRLMRVNKVTISELSKRMGITKKRIRRIR